jgi:hypothetical protein
MYNPKSALISRSGRRDEKWNQKPPKKNKGAKKGSIKDTQSTKKQHKRRRRRGMTTHFLKERERERKKKAKQQKP